MKLLFSKSEIEKAIEFLAKSLSSYLDSLNEEVHFITILKEGLHFSVDLSKKLENFDLIFDYVFLENVNPFSRELAINKDIFLPVKDKRVIVCSVLTRSGYEINFIDNYLKIRGAFEVKTISLICKEQAKIKPDYYYFTISNDYYLVGYGLDYNNKYMNLEDIYAIAD